MYTLIELDGTTEPTLFMKMLGTYELLDDAKESMARSVNDVVGKMMKDSDFLMEDGVDFERKFCHMSAHVFYGEVFYQWVIFDSEKPIEWSSLRYW